MAKVIGVADVPDMPGAGMLQFDDGRPGMLALPEVADEHRERLGLNAMTNGVAGPGTGTPDPEPPTQITLPHAGQTGTEGSPPMPPPEPGPVPGPNPSALGTAGKIAKAYDPSEVAHEAQQSRIDEIARTGVVPGSGAPATPAHWSPESKKATVEHGAPYNIEDAQARIAAGNETLHQQVLSQRDQFGQAAVEEAHLAAQRRAAEEAAARKAADIARAKQEFEHREAAMNQDLTAYSKNNAPDPHRFYEKQGTFATILSAIAQGLGAAGASLGHTQNFATNIVESAMQRDMQAQTKAYDEGLQTRNNALARYVRLYDGDISMAKSALAQQQNRVAEIETQRMVAQGRGQDLMNAAGPMIAKFKENQLLEEQRRKDLAIGKITEEASDKFHQASGGGGPHHLTLSEELAVAKAAADAKGKGEKDQGALGLSPQAEARQKAAYSSKIEPLAQFADSLSHRATLMGIHFDPKTGELTNAKGKQAQVKDLDIPVGAGVIGKHISGDVLTPKAMELRRAEENSVRLHAASVYNHSISAEEGADEVNRTIGSTDEAKLANMKYLAEEYRKRKTAIDTGAAAIDPRMVNARDQAEAAVNYARATGKPLPGPEPMMGHPSGNSFDGADGDSSQ